MSTDAVTFAVTNIKNNVAGGATLEGAVRNLAQLGVPPHILEAARHQYLVEVNAVIELKDPGALVDQEVLNGKWYAGPNPDHVLWPALKDKLAHGLPPEALGEIDRSSTRVVGLLRPPGATPIRTRGLVLGHVQSGKTTSFMSVAAKAADVGYRMVIVLSGITDNLRSQTQARLEAQLVGEQAANWYLLTSKEADFAETGNATALMQGNHRLLAVVKKNPHRLRRLRDWIRSAGEAAQLSCPILIIDDEADQASIDVGKKRMSVINKLIREILENPKAAYVAYTATPFANLLIDPSTPEGLYPRDFIVSLKTGDGYYGAERLFGRDLLEHVEDDAVAEPDDVIRMVPDADVPTVQPPKGKGAVFSWTPEMTPSLVDAVNWFFLATAGRRARGDHDAHSSMLVHTSMLSEAHARLHDVVSRYCVELERAVASGDAGVLANLEALWNSEQDRVVRQPDEEELSWDRVVGELGPVLSDAQVIVDNYRSDARLIYKEDEPSTVIAIGGNTLSRGLTLEGLVSSYFVRAASAYDTLLQMGRWFGYRRGYSDLVRIWMTDELRDWFQTLATVEAEIRHEIDRYELEALRPTQLAIKIRTDPAMTITNAAKMRNAVHAQLNYSGKREQMILFRSNDREWLKRNWDAGERLITNAASDPGVSMGRVRGVGRPLLTGVPVSRIREFVEAFSFHEDSQRLQTSLLLKYLEQENANGGLLHWNVVVMENQKPALGQESLGPFGKVNLIGRTKMSTSRPGAANIKALSGSLDRAADLPQILEGLGEQPSDKEIKNERDRLDAPPLLALYPIAPTVPTSANGRAPLEAAGPVLGVTFFFPNAEASGGGIDYVAADLSSIEVEDFSAEIEEADKLDEEEDVTTSGAGAP
ncbi:Z1 domain-containing protein [Nocardioides sp. J9]|uniref:Z1 domain-containing protein n=1 Tax=Nocardioides sp. J9 TaxID=935844 RepID=UPI0011A64808|nr:Z1 domain-containing protein [Nocardioides sp. J9]TWG93052.1 Z1 domain-containing protein [Nocardioides sp. J9]